MKTVLGNLVFIFVIAFNLYHFKVEASEMIEDWQLSPMPPVTSFVDATSPTTLNQRRLIDSNRTNIERLEETGIITVINPKEIAETELPKDDVTLKSLRKATQALLMRESGSVVFTGAPGVGKSYRLSLMLAYIEKYGPPELKNRIYVRGEASAFAARKDGLAGSVEGNVAKLIELSHQNPITILMDEIHALDGAGTHRGSSTDVFEMLKESLASGRIQIIGTTTDHEFESTFGGRTALAQRFVRFTVSEPKIDELIKILNGRYKSDMNRELSPEVMEIILKVSQVFGGTSSEPRRSLKLMDFIISREKLDQTTIATREDALKICSEFYNMDLELFLDPTKNEALITEAEKISQQKVIGQEHSVHEVFKSVRYWMSQSERSKPLSLVFYGGKGTGKTFFSSTIAESLQYKFFKISLPTMNPEAVIGQITTQLEMYPFTVFLMDEVDKADPRVQEALLSVLDSPTLNQQKMLSTGKSGPVVSVSTKNAMFLFTTNAGEELTRLSVDSDIAREVISQSKTMNKYLLDRMRKFVGFPTPGVPALEKIVSQYWAKVTSGFQDQLREHKITDTMVFNTVAAKLMQMYARPSEPIKNPIGFIASQSEPKPQMVLDLNSISIRAVENIVDGIAEEVLSQIRRPAVKTETPQATKTPGEQALSPTQFVQSPYTVSVNYGSAPKMCLNLFIKK